MPQAAAVKSFTPKLISNSDLSDDAKLMWCTCAWWGTANGLLSAKKLDAFVWTMSNELALDPARIIWLTEELIRSGYHPELFAREITFDEPPGSVNARKVRLLKTIGRFNEE